MASGAETGLELKLGMWTGCTVWADQPFTVDTVAEARASILQYAVDALGHHAHDPEKPPLPPKSGPTPPTNPPDSTA